MRYARLFWGVFSISARRELAHRTNLLFQLALALVGAAAGVAALTLVYGQTETLAGWRLGDAVVLFGVYSLMSGLLGAFIEPNLGWFAARVRQGLLDDILLQPVPSVVAASLGTCQPWALVGSALGLVAVGGGLASSGGGLSLGRTLAFVLLLGAGLAITWATRVLLASFAFWAPHVEPDILYGTFWELGRYPVGVYHPAVRWMLTFVVPVAFISTLPAQALVRGVPTPVLLGGLAAGVGAVAVGVLVWRTGLRRYTSATS